MTTEPEAAPAPLFKKRGAKANFRKRAATPPQDESGSDSYSEDEQGHKVKRRRKAGLIASSSSLQKPPTINTHDTSKFAADRTATIEDLNEATKQSNWFDEKLDERNLLGTTRSKPASAASEVAAPDGNYKGAAGYSSFIQKNPNSQDRKFGPIKAPTNLRTITITDYAPDVCKDYKQTGFCGFGDSCKFLHAREDYKQGWALDRDWEISTKGKKMEGKIVASANRGDKLDDDEDEGDAALLEKIPFACIICKEPYKNPIVTKCDHYFCESCALKRYRKNPNCAACGAGTNGVFNTAKTLHKILERKRLREERLKAKAEEDAAEQA